jgi:hypothetical protein
VRRRWARRLQNIHFENVDWVDRLAPNRTVRICIGALTRYAPVLCALLALLAAPRSVAGEDRVTELAKVLSSGSSEKSRLTAAAALANIGDRSTLRPLVAALDDPSPKIRLVAVVALGRLEHKAALPALRTAALGDPDPAVRARARTAASAIATANRLADPFHIDVGAMEVAAAPPVATTSATPRQTGLHPDLYVVIKSAADDSPGKNDRQAREIHASILRKTLGDHLRRAANVTTVPTEAQRWGLGVRNLDLSVVKMNVVTHGTVVEVEAQLRLAISDGDGKMLSFLSNGAKVQVARRSLDSRILATLRKEALENAMRGMFDNLLVHLREKPKS